MTESKLLDEVALNTREIHHDKWGSFIVKRPTNRVYSEMETTKTRSINRDLQEKEKVFDPMSGKDKVVPAFLTRRSKERLLEEFGEWGKEDVEKLQEAQNNYRDICVQLEREGFEGLHELDVDYKEVFEELKKQLEKLSLELTEDERDILFPMHHGKEVSVDPERFFRVKQSLERRAKSTDVANILEAVETCHKQYDLVLKGMAAQSQLYTITLREIELFSDTVEMRADNKARLVKIIRCSFDTNGEPLWKDVNACQEESPDKVSWILEQIERFERLDPDQETKTSKYNFFQSLLGNPSEKSEESPDQEVILPDGEPAEKTQ